MRHLLYLIITCFSISLSHPPDSNLMSQAYNNFLQNINIAINNKPSIDNAQINNDTNDNNDIKDTNINDQTNLDIQSNLKPIENNSNDPYQNILSNDQSNIIIDSENQKDNSPIQPSKNSNKQDIVLDDEIEPVENDSVENTPIEDTPIEDNNIEHNSSDNNNIDNIENNLNINNNVEDILNNNLSTEDNTNKPIDIPNINIEKPIDPDDDIPDKVESSSQPQEDDVIPDEILLSHVQCDPENPGTIGGMNAIKEYYSKLPYEFKKAIYDQGYLILNTTRSNWSEYGFKDPLIGITFYGKPYIYVRGEYEAECIYHEMFHFLVNKVPDFMNLLYNNITTPIYEEERFGILKYMYTSTVNANNQEEYFCESFEGYYTNPEGMKKFCPKTYQFIDNLVNRKIYINDESIYFFKCNWITELELGDDVLHLAKYCFDGWTSLTKVTYKGITYTDWDTLVKVLKANDVNVTKKSFLNTGLPK